MFAGIGMNFGAITGHDPIFDQPHFVGNDQHCIFQPIVDGVSG